MSSPETADALAARSEEVALEVDRLLAGGGVEDVPLEAVQRLLAAAVRLYGAKAEQLDSAPAFPAGAEVTATDVARTAMAMLTAAELEVFELGMWQVWNGR